MKYSFNRWEYNNYHYYDVDKVRVRHIEYFAYRECNKQQLIYFKENYF